MDDGSRILVTSEELVDANKDYRGTRSNLTVTNLSYEDGGTFECHAMNNMGNDSADSVISVRCKFKIYYFISSYIFFLQTFPPFFP